MSKVSKNKKPRSIYQLELGGKGQTDEENQMIRDFLDYVKTQDCLGYEEALIYGWLMVGSCIPLQPNVGHRD